MSIILFLLLLATIITLTAGIIKKDKTLIITGIIIGILFGIILFNLIQAIGTM